MNDKLTEIRQKGLLRELKCLEQRGTTIEYEGKCYLNLSSNDYLGLSARLDFQEEFFRSLDGKTFLMGASSSRLLTGNSPCAEALEHYLGKLYGRSCLLYNSGYHANIGVLPAVTEKNDLIIADKLVHASIIDGLKLCDCEWKRFRHNDYNDLERLLKLSDGKYHTVYIVTESIFSMDGDAADIATLVDLKERYHARLYIDEAHGFGVRGVRGLGLIEEAGLLHAVDLIIGTLGKAAASEGAFVICGQAIKDWLINQSRSLIFTTAAPSINLLWSHFAILKIVSMEAERERLREITHLFRGCLQTYHLMGSTHIVPLLLGENEVAMAFARHLQEAGVWVMPIRSPSVPAGQARVRFSLSAALTNEQIQQVYDALSTQYVLS